jgi:hypothetical protein
MIKIILLIRSKPAGPEVNALWRDGTKGVKRNRNVVADKYGISPRVKTET